MKRPNNRRRLPIQWHITDACDQRCKHCYIFAENPGIRPRSMPFPQMKEVVDRCCAYAARKGMFPTFAIGGGDPLLNPDFWQLAEYLRDLGLPFAMMGNPFQLSAEVCERLHACGCKEYQVSIDGLRQTHDSTRKSGSFDATWECLPLLHNAGITSVIMTTVSAENIAEVPAIIDLAVEHRAGGFAFARYVPTGPDKSNPIEPLQYRELLDLCYRKFQEYRKQGCWTQFAEKDHLFVLYKYEEGIFAPSDAAVPRDPWSCECCHIGSTLCILPDGTVMACRRVAGSDLGSIFDDDFLGERDAFAERARAWRDVSAYEGCSRCRLAPWCRGCHAIASGQFGDFHARDPQCWRVVE